MITKRLSWYSPYSPDLNPIEFIWKSIKRVISIVFVENVNLQRAYHLLSRGSKSLSHCGFSFVGDYISPEEVRVVEVKGVVDTGVTPLGVPASSRVLGRGGQVHYSR